LFGIGAVILAEHPDGIGAHHADQFRSLWRRINAWWIRRRAPELVAPPAADEGVSTAPVPSDRPLVRHAAGSEVEQAVLRVEGVRAGYDQLEVLHGVDLALEQGSITVLLGANGAGKSTLCNVLAGVVDCRSGQLRFDDKRIDKLRPGERVADGLFIAPESRGVFPGLTVDENLSIWLTTREERSRALDRFPLLAKRRNLAAGSLSGGEQQLLTLAPAFVRTPRVLVADEPTLGLAPRLRKQVMDLCCELRQQGVTILLVEEKAREALEVADRVAVLELGRVVWDRRREQVDERELTAVYLGVAH
jgi:ABC-type branched-subunit amino acid transport system ATPase component